MGGRGRGLKEGGVWGSFLTQKEVVRAFLTAQSRGKREHWEVVRELNQGLTDRETRKGGGDGKGKFGGMGGRDRERRREGEREGEG